MCLQIKTHSGLEYSPKCQDLRMEAHFQNQRQQTRNLGVTGPSQRHVARRPLVAASRGPAAVAVEMEDAHELWAKVMENTWNK